MFVEWRRRAARALLVVLPSVLVACSDTSSPDSVSAPSEVQAVALGLNAIRVTWRPVAGSTSYVLERREDLSGPFQQIAESIRGDGSALVSYFDTDVRADRFYGYRVRAIGALNARSDASTVAGARTAASPGILVRTSTTFATPASADPDGYQISVRGPRDTVSFTLPINGSRLISPLSRGTYTVVLRGMAVNCNPTTLGDTITTTQVNDEGLSTVGSASFSVSCRDPQKASLVTTVRTTGDSIDADGVLVTVSGIIRENGVPANERVYFQSRTVRGQSAAARFDDLRPGDYEVSVSDVEAPCVLEGEAKRMLQPKALAVDTVPFTLVCRKPVAPVDTAGRPLVLRQTWAGASARPGDKISLLTSLDLRARPTIQVAGASATIRFDNTVVRFDSARTTRAFDVTAINLAQPGIVAFAAAQTGSEPRTGNIEILRSWFTVIGAVGASVATTTTVTDVIAGSQEKLTSQTRAVEDTLLVSAASAPNQAPTAVITGPTSGVAGASLTFSGSQSSDPDGSIVSYAWDFGDGQSGTGASVTKTYANAGTYSVRLTVTDAQAATATRVQTVTITASAPTTGSISGVVSSSAGGGLAGVTVTVAGGGTAVTGTSGAYTITNVAAGSRSVSVSGLPAGCTAPANQSTTVTAGAASTVNFTVTCTGGDTNRGTVQGRVTRAGDGSGIGFARVTLLPAGGTALPAATTGTDGAYSIANVPLGSGADLGRGTVTVSELPSNCTAPASVPYTGLTSGASVTINITVTCAAPTTGTITGRITKSTGGDAAGVVVGVVPTGVAALPTVTSGSNGTFTVSSVPVGGGTLVLSTLPSGCTAPADLSYTGVTAGGTLTRNLTLSCVAGAHTYPVTGTWGTIANTGPTGRQVTLTIAVDMGSAPGRSDVSGAAADPLAAVTLQVVYDSTKFAYQSRSLLSPDEFDLGVAGTVNGTGVNKITTIAVASTSAQTKTGAFQLVRLTFNIRSGASGTVTPTLAVAQMLAGAPSVVVTSSVVVQPLAPLTIPP